jgi:ABC-type lipoprotein export system ATPase subunit
MLLEVQKVNKRFGGAVPVHVLKDIDLGMERGDFAALVGPSGAGKTTLLNIISTLDSPTSGQVRIDGVNVHELAEAKLNGFRNEHLGFIFQDDLLLPNLDALENVMMPGRIARKPQRQLQKLAEDLLGRVGLGDRLHHRPGELSGGQRQRVNLARALTNGPKLLLADEPTARLDSETGEAIVELLVELNQQLGVTILMVTHERDVAERARRIVEFLDGRVDVDRRTDVERKLGFRQS